MHSFEKFKLQPTWKANWVGGRGRGEGKEIFFLLFPICSRLRMSSGGVWLTVVHISGPWGVSCLFLFPISLLISFDSRLGIWAFPGLLVDQDVFIFLIFNLYNSSMSNLFFLRK